MIFIEFKGVKINLQKRIKIQVGAWVSPGTPFQIAADQTPLQAGLLPYQSALSEPQQAFS